MTVRVSNVWATQAGDSQQTEYVSHVLWIMKDAGQQSRVKPKHISPLCQYILYLEDIRTFQVYHLSFLGVGGGGGGTIKGQWKVKVDGTVMYACYDVLTHAAELHMDISMDKNQTT